MRPWLLALLALLPSAAIAGDLKVATWNLEWLTTRPPGDPALPTDVVPKTAADFAVLKRYAAQLGADVVAMEEVDGPAAASVLFPSDRYALYFTGDDVVQRVGIAVRRGIAVHRNPDLTGLDLYPEARHHLRSGLDLTLDLPSGPLRLLAVHLKTGCQRDNLDTSSRPQCATLRGQLPVLRGWETTCWRPCAPMPRWPWRMRATTAHAGVADASSIISWPAARPAAGST